MRCVFFYNKNFFSRIFDCKIDELFNIDEMDI